MNYKAATELELWECCRQDDMKAYNELFDRFVGRLHRMGSRYVKDACAVEELVIDILFNIWTRRHEIDLRGNLSAYLFQAMHNRAISLLRKRSPATVEVDDLPENMLIADTTADQQLSFKEAQIVLEERLAQLSPQRQMVFRLSREQHMSYAEIAREMNLSPNTVKNHMNAALEYLRGQYPHVTISTTAILFLLFW